MHVDLKVKYPYYTISPSASILGDDLPIYHLLLGRNHNSDVVTILHQVTL
ncbi:hypothetical protein Fmac_003727 [Flemingia macrophylla]|uniref:Uncharacterized protein n=1 Tax=Flemingia macrophylla TaxID=520843 RepID=A0ABD1N2X9_9FABA